MKFGVSATGRRASMKTVKMDKGLAKYIIQHQDEDDFSVDVEECEKCGAVFASSMGHDCEKTIVVPVHEEGEVDEG